MAWTYVVPVYVIEPIAVQVPARLRNIVIDSARQAIHAAVTQAIGAGKSPGLVPVGTMIADIDSQSTASAIVFQGDLSLAELGEKQVAGRLGRKRPAARPWAADVRPSGPDWVYPGRAMHGVFADAVDSVLANGRGIVEEVLAA